MRNLFQLPLVGGALLAALLSCGMALAAPAEKADDVSGAKEMLAKLPPPPSKPDDPAKVAAARAFIIAYHPRQDPALLAKMLPKFMPRMIAGAKEENPKVDVKKFVAERTAQILDQNNKSLDEQAHVVSRHFTLQELNGLTVFYRNGLGKKLTDETPKIQTEMRIAARRKMLLSQLPGMEKKPGATPAAPTAPKGSPHK